MDSLILSLVLSLSSCVLYRFSFSLVRRVFGSLMSVSANGDDDDDDDIIIFSSIAFNFQVFSLSISFSLSSSFHFVFHFIFSLILFSFELLSVLSRQLRSLCSAQCYFIIGIKSQTIDKLLCVCVLDLLQRNNIVLLFFFLNFFI